MAQARVIRTFLAAALACLGACSLAVDTSELDHQCGPRTKQCGHGDCVSVDDPAYGCTSNFCDPCPLDNAIPECNMGACRVKACLFGFDCPNSAGCQVNILVDEKNCGSCGKSCDAGFRCRNGQCAPSTDVPQRQ